MIKYGSRIIHLGDKRIFDFLRENKAPLVLYGCGEEGKTAYEILTKHAVPITAVVDADKDMQGSIFGNHTVLSPQEVVKSVDKNAYICVAIAKKEIVLSVCKFFSDAGYKNVLNLLLKNFEAMYLCTSFQKQLPAVIIGTNELSRRVGANLEKNGVEVLCFCDDNPTQDRFDKLPLNTIERAIQNPIDKNIIICNDSVYAKTALELIKNGAMGQVYRGITKTMGEFSVEKYSGYKPIVWTCLLDALAHVNSIYHSMEQKQSRELFRMIVKDALINGREDKGQSLKISDDCSLIRIYLKEFTYDTLIFENIRQDLTQLIGFLASMKIICLDEGRQVGLQMEENKCEIVFTN